MDKLRGLWRGKRNDKSSRKYGEWYQGVDVMHKTVRGELCLCNPGEDWVSVDPSTLGECTGLRDENGTLIFEGDIVKSLWQHLGSTEEIVGVIKLENCTFVIETDNHYFYFVDDIFPDKCEIIGNIRDNSKLLPVHGEDGENNAQ